MIMMPMWRHSNLESACQRWRVAAEYNTETSNSPDERISVQDIRSNCFVLHNIINISNTILIAHHKLFLSY